MKTWKYFKANYKQIFKRQYELWVERVLAKSIKEIDVLTENTYRDFKAYDSSINKVEKRLIHTLNERDGFLHDIATNSLYITPSTYEEFQQVIDTEKEELTNEQ